MTNNLLVLQSDFGLVDGAVSAMIGVALQEEPSLGVHHLTHDITPYNTFEASYRLFQTVEYWPEGTTFVSVVDPGVGSSRKSVVALTKTGNISSHQITGHFLISRRLLVSRLFVRFPRLRIVVVIQSFPIPSMVVMFMPIQVPN